MLGRLLGARKTAQAKGGAAKVSTVDVPCPRKWTLPVAVRTNTKWDWPSTPVTLTFADASNSPQTIQMTSAKSAAVVFEGLTGVANKRVTASVTGWSQGESAQLTLHQGDNASEEEVWIERWALKVTVNSSEANRWPAGDISAGLAGANDATLTAKMSRTTQVFNFRGAAAVKAPLTLTLTDPDWKIVKLPQIDIKPGEDRFINLVVRPCWQLTVTVKSKRTVWPVDEVVVNLPGSLPAGKGVMSATSWDYVTQGFDDVNGPVSVAVPEWAMVGAAKQVSLKAGDIKKVELEVDCWVLRVTVESTTAFGWPEKDVTVKLASGGIPAKTIRMSAKTAEVRFEGTSALKTKVSAESEDWTLVRERSADLEPGKEAATTVRLNGVDLEFELRDAADAPIADEKIKLFRADGTTAVPRAPNKTDSKGRVKLTNVPPEEYQIKFPKRYDVEWEEGATEDL